MFIFSMSLKTLPVSSHRDSHALNMIVIFEGRVPKKMWVGLHIHYMFLSMLTNLTLKMRKAKRWEGILTVR